MIEEGKCLVGIGKGMPTLAPHRRPSANHRPVAIELEPLPDSDTRPFVTRTSRSIQVRVTLTRLLSTSCSTLSLSAVVPFLFLSFIIFHPAMERLR